ncbi:MalY/PatB family protein [Halalkalibacillus halophilus]|uniref:MalY/PatB family protein n=1 Tax=Halalkalibacillus halophilus TaxID=392827 RepID=UPI0004295D33|nr:PatB family C-S lyase [Halalkalibacillus halophilus]
MEQFNRIISRENTGAVKLEFREKLFGSNEILPMWVADMDLAAPNAVQEAIQKRAEHNLYGYTMHNPDLIEAIKNWIRNRHEYTINTELLSFSPGVIPSLHALVQAFTNERDQIVIQPPVYPPFYSVVRNHNRTLIENELIIDEGKYKINFEQLEQQFKNGAKAFILCSPHNPVGRVWTKEELKKIADLCIEYNVFLFSDEIHADIAFDHNKHIPSASISREIEQLTFTLMAPSKTFNIAGLQGSYVISPNEYLKEVLNKQLMKQGIMMLNTFAYVAMQASYESGAQWLEELNILIKKNADFVIERLHTSNTGIRVFQPEGTYLLWLDFRSTDLSHEEIKNLLQTKAKVGLNDGQSFGETSGNLFMRMNIASPPSIVQEGVERIIHTFTKNNNME